MRGAQADTQVANVNKQMGTSFSPIAELCPARTERPWFCIRTQLKHEHIAAAHLKQMPGVDAFNPQLRLLRSTRRGRRWATESLFPSYVFASFVLESMFEKVAYAPGVKVVVRFGEHVPQIPNGVIAELRRQLEELPSRVLTDAPEEGEEVEIAAGPFAGMKASVTRVRPGNERAQMLIEVMGRPVPAEIDLDKVLFSRRTAAQVALGGFEPVFVTRPMISIPI